MEDLRFLSPIKAGKRLEVDSITTPAEAAIKEKLDFRDFLADSYLETANVTNDGLRAGSDISSGTVEQGDVFGETGLMKSQLRCSKAVCLEDCELVKIAKVDFMRRLDGCDPLVRRLVDTMVGQSSKSERSTSQVGIAEAA